MLSKGCAALFSEEFLVACCLEREQLTRIETERPARALCFLLGSQFATPLLVLALLFITVPLSLAQAEQNALQFQPALRQARANLKGASGRAIQGHSYYLPQGTFNAAYQRTTSNLVQRPGYSNAVAGTGSTTAAAPSLPVYSNQTYNYFNLTAQVSQLVFDFGSSIARWKAGDDLEKQATNDVVTAEQTVLLNVRRLYFQTRAQQDLVSVAVETTKNFEKHLQQIEALVKASLRADIDLAQARTDVANARAAQIQAQGNLGISQAQLAQAMGLEAQARYEMADATIAELPNEDAMVEQLIDEALAGRADYKALMKEKSAREAQTWIYKGQYGPSVNLIANGSAAGLAVQTLMPNWYVGVALQWNFLQGGLTFRASA